jgi:hypothetical protein
MASIIGWEGGLATCPLNRDNPIHLANLKILGACACRDGFSLAQRAEQQREGQLKQSGAREAKRAQFESETE